MTTILLLAPFFLGISQVDAAKSDCSYVIESWKKMGKTTNVNSISSTACCKTLVYSNGSIITKSSGIPGVYCTSTGIVTDIHWMSKNLKGPIPLTIPDLQNLRVL